MGQRYNSRRYIRRFSNRRVVYLLQEKYDYEIHSMNKSKFDSKLYQNVFFSLLDNFRCYA